MKVIGLINNKRVFKSAVAVIVMAALLTGLQPGSTAAGAGAEKSKSETVYAVLGNDGSYTGATVVNCFTRGGEFVDYGEYTSIKSLMGSQSPMIEGDRITWSASVAGDSGAFYYQGETRKPLPVSIGIGYCLNGKETAAEDITGKTGELRIEFTLKNETGTGEIDEATGREVLIPLAVSVSIVLGNSMYSVLEVPENGSAVLAGSSYTLSYASFPLPEDTFSFTVFGRDMVLDPINIVVLPKSPPGIDSYGDFIDVGGISQSADDMISRAGDMEQGLGDMLSALYDMKDGAKLLQDGISDINGGAKSLSGGASSLYGKVQLLGTNAHGFYSGFSEFAGKFGLFDAGIGGLNDNLTEMAEQLDSLSRNAALLDNKVGEVGGGLNGIRSSNRSITEMAGRLDDTYPDAAALTAALQSQQSAIDSLADGSVDLKTLSEGVSGGAQSFYDGFSIAFIGSVRDLSNDCHTLHTSCLSLLDGAQAIDTGCAQLSGGASLLKGGADGISDGTAGIAKKLPEIISGIDHMIDGVKALKDGISGLNSEGLQELKSTVEGLDGYLGKLSGKASAYGSFMDERNAGNSTVQFILKTKGIGEQD